MKPPIERIEVPIQELRSLLERARKKLGVEGYRKLKAAIDTLAHLTSLIEDQQTTIQKLRELLRTPASTEKTEKVLENAGLKTGPEDSSQKTPRKPRKGHGRKGAGAYTAARRISVSHASLSNGGPCPKCGEGPCTRRAIPAFWCDWWAGRRSKPRSMRSKNCAAACA